MKLKVNEGERIEHNGVTYEPGAEIEIDEKDAGDLKAAKTLLDKKLVTQATARQQPAR